MLNYSSLYSIFVIFNYTYICYNNYIYILLIIILLAFVNFFFSINYYYSNSSKKGTDRQTENQSNNIN